MERNNFFSLLLLFLVLIVGVVESFDYHEKELESEEGLQGMYDRWRAHHKVTEKSPERFNVFVYNVEKIHSINKLNRPYKLEVNKFATLTSHEFRTTYADSKIEHYNALAGVNNLKGNNNLKMPGPGCNNCPAAPGGGNCNCPPGCSCPGASGDGKCPCCPAAPGGGNCHCPPGCSCPGASGDGKCPCCPTAPGDGNCHCPPGCSCPGASGDGKCPCCSAPPGDGNCHCPPGCSCPGASGDEKCPCCPAAPGGSNCPCPPGCPCPATSGDGKCPCPAAPAKLPPRIDWREHNAVTPVKNQAQCGSCYAFAAVAAIESKNALVTGQLVTLAEQQIIDCDTAARSNGCDGGVVCGVYTYVHGAGGIALNESYPYVAKKGQCDKSKWSQKAVTVDEGKEVVPINDEKAMMEAVAKNPVVVCMDTNHESFAYYKEGIYNGPCGNAGNHAMLNVGYDETPDGQKYWIIKNSWGHDWGEDGYMRVQRGGVPPQGMCGLYRCSDYPRKSPDTKNVGI